MRICFALFLILNYVCQLDVTADDSAYSAKPRFPAPYSDFEVVIGSISHDDRFAAILNNSSDGSDDSRNYLVALSPFQVLTVLPTNAVFIDGSRQGGLTLNWSKDNSKAVVIQAGKFGPEKIYVLELVNGNVVKTIDLLTILRQFVLPDFKKSGADPFNENFDFFLDDDGGWTLNAQNQIPIDCEFTNDPRLSARVSWTGRLSGTWDAKTEKLLNAHFTRSSPR